MIIHPTTYDFNGHTLLFRSADKDDARLMIDYLIRLCGESLFLSRYPDEYSDMTVETEKEFIKQHIEDDRAALILAYLDGVYVGNVSFEPAGASHRNRHRAEIGIGLYADYTNMGIGQKLFGFMLDTVKSCGFEKAELSVNGKNSHALHMYEKFGFKECGRIKNAQKYDDGTYADDIIMERDII